MLQKLAPFCRVGRYRVRFSVQDRLRTHDFNGAMLRGAFGTALHESPELYGRLFDGASEEGGQTRAYRFRSVSGQRMLMEPGTALQFGLDLFGPANEQLPEVVAALRRMGERGLGPDSAVLALREVAQELPTGEHLAMNWGTREVRSPLHCTLEDYPLPLAGHYVLNLSSPTVFREEKRDVVPTLDRITTAATRRLGSLIGVDTSSYPATHLEGRPLWIQEREFYRKSRREGDQLMRGWVGAFEVWVSRAEEAFPLWVASLIGAGRHTSFGFGEAELLAMAPRLEVCSEMEVHA
jgi:hypothetical protein